MNLVVIIIGLFVLLFGEHYMSRVDRTIWDGGFCMTQKCWQWLVQNPGITWYLATLQTIAVIVATVVYGLWDRYYRCTSHNILEAILILGMGRLFASCLTSLPAPDTVLVCNTDWPQCVMPGTHAIFFYSGHAAAITLVWLDSYSNWWGCVGWGLILLQQIWFLLSSRGHYSIDIVVGILMAVIVFNVL